ncbi:MAG TPA: sugar ABC transporter permease [Nitrososphaeraceae archaeon]|jgi:ABC-type sugar transport system permease subunit|nr:sugar ABC transporter permease [Nitrososphaeraceae archaeon]HSF51029.1 sugar ABC transporter permease [Nitrososphaeraceae archaeon]
MLILKNFEPYLFLLPGIIILFLFLFFPLLWNIYISLHDVSILTIIKEWEFVGFKNFNNIFADPNFFNSLKVTLVFVLGTVLLQFGIGLLIALLLNQQIRASGLFRTLFIIPWTVSTVITGFSFKFLFDDNFGIINYGIEKLGLDSIQWFSDPALAIWTIIIANTWYGTPFTILFLTAGLLSINPTLYEAAIIDGATKFRRFIYITLPLLKPFILTNLILVTVWTINFFDLQLIMTNGGPLFSTTTMSLYMYKQAFEFGYFSEGAAVGILLIIMNISVALVYIRLFDGRNKK